MKFKIDKNLQRLADEMFADPVVVADKLCKYFIAAGMFADDWSNYGSTVREVVGKQHVKDFCPLLAGYIYGDASRIISSELYDAFCNLTIMGEDDCPYCGGELRFVEIDGHELNDGDYYVPNSYIVDNYIYKCCVCGEIIKSEKEL